jgi:hypothetical protein
MIWEYEADLRPFMGIAHPLGLMGGLPPERRDRLRRQLEDAPPAFIIVDGFTEVTYLRQLPTLREIMAERYTLELSIPGTRFPTPVDVYRLRDSSAGTGAGRSTP